LQIDWRIEAGKEIISGKDQLNAKWAELDEDSLF
jgi:hypothetical protein